MADPLNAKVREAIRAYYAALDAEALRLLAEWPEGLGQPRVMYGPGFTFLGLGNDDGVVLPARPIVVEVVT